MPGRYPRLLTLRTLVSARFSTSIRHLAAIFRVTSDSRRRDQEGRSEAKEKERNRADGERGAGGFRAAKRLLFRSPDFYRVIETPSTPRQISFHVGAIAGASVESGPYLARSRH